MTRFRYWLADLISGGELTWRLDRWQEAEQSMIRWAKKAVDRNHALRRIAAEVKPTSNATVKRMGRIAEEALK